jgi:hypothetical protein
VFDAYTTVEVGCLTLDTGDASSFRDIRDILNKPFAVPGIWA